MELFYPGAIAAWGLLVIAEYNGNNNKPYQEHRQDLLAGSSNIRGHPQPPASVSLIRTSLDHVQ
jgi:hypothetical protein